MHPEILLGIGGGLVGVWWIALARRRKPAPQRPTWQARAGQAGENRTTTILRQHGLTVWPDVRVAHGRRTSQCDQIVVGPFGLVVIETKHWAGTMARQGDQWIQRKTPQGKIHWYRSPEGQNAYHCQVVREVLKTQGLKRVPIMGAIVLSNPHAHFADQPGNQPIGTPEQIAQWIQQLPVARRFDANRVERVLWDSGVGAHRAMPWG